MAAVKKMIGGGLMMGMDRSEHKPAKRHLKKLTIERAANGGVSIQHHYADSPYGSDEPPHVFGSDQHEEAMAHIKKHLGMNRVAAAAKARESIGKAVKAAPEEDANEGEEEDGQD